MGRSAPYAEPVVAARAAGLRYVHDDFAGISRLKHGRHFRYLDPAGKPIRGESELARIRALAIPPAYTEVWICPFPEGHLQATARDARGRKQYRYHKRWREIRDETKFDRVLAFATRLPVLRARLAEDLRLPGMPRRKVLATAVRLLETTSIRVGNQQYARENGSFGVTTLRDDHLEVRGALVRFRFRGKSGKKHSVELNDRRLARIMARMQDLPGQHLFSYEDDDGGVHPVDSSDVNDYLREVTAGEFTAKDFRTWIGTVGCVEALAARLSDVHNVKARKGALNEALSTGNGRRRCDRRSRVGHRARVGCRAGY